MDSQFPVELSQAAQGFAREAGRENRMWIAALLFHEVACQQARPAKPLV